MNQTATDLVNRFKMVLMHEDTQCGNEILCTTIAKQCALICVDEILNLMINNFKWDVNHNGNIDYWQDVKNEIEKL